jgi:hypothetical protein
VMVRKLQSSAVCFFVSSVRCRTAKARPSTKTERFRLCFLAVSFYPVYPPQHKFINTKLCSKLTRELQVWQLNNWTDGFVWQVATVASQRTFDHVIRRFRVFMSHSHWNSVCLQQIFYLCNIVLIKEIRENAFAKTLNQVRQNKTTFLKANCV